MTIYLTHLFYSSCCWTKDISAHSSKAQSYQQSMLMRDLSSRSSSSGACGQITPGSSDAEGVGVGAPWSQRLASYLAAQHREARLCHTNHNEWANSHLNRYGSNVSKSRTVLTRTLRKSVSDCSLSSVVDGVAILLELVIDSNFRWFTSLSLRLTKLCKLDNNRLPLLLNILIDHTADYAIPRNNNN